MKDRDDRPLSFDDLQRSDIDRAPEAKGIVPANDERAKSPPSYWPVVFDFAVYMGLAWWLNWNVSISIFGMLVHMSVIYAVIMAFVLFKVGRASRSLKGIGYPTLYAAGLMGLFVSMFFCNGAVSRSDFPCVFDPSSPYKTEFWQVVAYMSVVGLVCGIRAITINKDNGASMASGFFGAVKLTIILYLFFEGNMRFYGDGGSKENFGLLLFFGAIYFFPVDVMLGRRSFREDKTLKEMEDDVKRRERENSE